MRIDLVDLDGGVVLVKKSFQCHQTMRETGPDEIDYTEHVYRTHK